MSMRSAASESQLRQLRFEPRGARSGGRGVGSGMVLPRRALAASLAPWRHGGAVGSLFPGPDFR